MQSPVFHPPRHSHQPEYSTVPQHIRHRAFLRSNSYHLPDRAGAGMTTCMYSLTNVFVLCPHRRGVFQVDTSTAMQYSTLHDDHSQQASQSTSLVAGMYRCSFTMFVTLGDTREITALHITTSKLICNNSIWQYLGRGQIPALSGPADIIRELPTNESDTTHPVLSTMYSKHDRQLPCTASAHGLTHSSQQPSPSPLSINSAVSNCVSTHNHSDSNTLLNPVKSQTLTNQTSVCN